ncbi:MAG: zinc ribbon domain-containing protein [Magnetococcales bacterium]|nr:zinc ribbon domain-containing protein [Magnetococcales bacterium]NGZ25986.1 zinc ribbon domain-containing protein [Magnetococcales bacterium]
MPTYDFKCEECGHGFEKNLAMGATFDGKCPKCESGKVHKVFTTAGVLGSSGGGGFPGGGMPPPSCPTGGCGGGMCGLG